MTEGPQRGQFPRLTHKLTVLLQFLSVLQLRAAALLPVNKQHKNKSHIHTIGLDPFQVQ